MESRTQKAKKNIGMSVLQNMINLGITMAGRIVFARCLSSSYFGINGLFANVLGMLSIADLGMTTAMMYRMYKPLAENDQEKLASLVSFFRKVFLIIAAVVFAVGISLIPFLKYIVNLPSDIPNLYVFYFLNLIGTTMSYFFIYRTILVTADQKNYLLVRSSIIFKIITFVLQMVVLICLKSYLGYLIIQISVSIVNNLYQNHIALKLYPFLRNIKPVKLPVNEIKSIFIDIKALFLYRISSVIQSNTDSIMISIFVGTITVGYYSNYTAITVNVVAILNMIFNNLKAGVGNKVAMDDSGDDAYKLFRTMELFNYWLVLGSSIAIFVLSAPFMELCYGSEYVLSDIVVFAIVLNFYVNNIRQTMWAYREATGIFKQTQYITMVTATLNVVLSIIFGNLWGLFGIIIATVLAKLLFAWWREPQILFGVCFHRNPISYYTTYIIRLLYGVLLGGIVHFVCRHLPAFNVLTTLILNTIVAAVLTLAGLLLYSFRQEEFKYLKGYFLKGLKK